MFKTFIDINGNKKQYPDPTLTSPSIALFFTSNFNYYIYSFYNNSTDEEAELSEVSEDVYFNFHSMYKTQISNNTIPEISLPSKTAIEGLLSFVYVKSHTDNMTVDEFIKFSQIPT